MKFKIYQIDAFAERLFEGNPAAVIPLEAWLPEPFMQAIAQENNLSETAFFVPLGDGYQIRWFTPNKEVRLCGHATLASAHVLFEHLGYTKNGILFESLSGQLLVSKADNFLTLNFPAQPPQACETPELLVLALGREPTVCLTDEDYVAVFDSEEDILDLEPNHELLKQLDRRGVIVTAKSTSFDFVSRFFVPKFGILEDPVTGSAHTKLAPYWAGVLGKTKLRAKQVSQRGGKLLCELKGDRVLISGRAVSYSVGDISIPDGELT